MNPTIEEAAAVAHSRINRDNSFPTLPSNLRGRLYLLYDISTLAVGRLADASRVNLEVHAMRVGISRQTRPAALMVRRSAMERGST